MSNGTYLTVGKTAETEIVILKSRFIGSCFPCTTEQEALTHLQEIRERWKSASHYCYAYIIGKNMGIMRYSDDGEPGGTAGLPIINTMKAKHIVDCCVVVTRYFGGILLGTGGLSRAYAQSCGEALEQAGIVAMELTQRYRCVVPYTVWESVRYHAEKLPVQLRDAEYGSEISFTLLVRREDSDSVVRRFRDISRNQMRNTFVDETYSAWENAAGLSSSVR